MDKRAQVYTRGLTQQCCWPLTRNNVTSRVVPVSVEGCALRRALDLAISEWTITALWNLGQYHHG